MNFVEWWNVVSKAASLERSQDLLMTEGVFTSNREQSGENNLDDLELPFFDFNTITLATNNFSEENKLGQGGFGIVYKVSFLFFYFIINKFCYFWCNDLFFFYIYNIYNYLLSHQTYFFALDFENEE